jgi:hypothetical protein
MSSSAHGLSGDASDAYSALHNLKSTPNPPFNIMSSYGHDLTGGASGVHSDFISLKDAPNLETTIMSSCRPSLIDGAGCAYSDSDNIKSAPNHQSYNFNSFGDIVKFYPSRTVQPGNGRFRLIPAGSCRKAQEVGRNPPEI